MRQSSVIILTLGIAFAVYITAKGRLPLYLSFFGLSSKTAASNSALGNSSGLALPGLSSGGLGSGNIGGFFGGGGLSTGGGF